MKSLLSFKMQSNNHNKERYKDQRRIKRRRTRTRVLWKIDDDDTETTKIKNNWYQDIS